MTRVRVWRDQARGCYALAAHGHADYRAGGDIVCAAVSAIVYALAGALSNIPHAALRYRDEAGRFTLYCESGDKAACGAVLMAEIGLRQIAAAYPDNVTVARAEKCPEAQRFGAGGHA